MKAIDTRTRAIPLKAALCAGIALLMLIVGFGIAFTSGAMQGETPEQQAERMEDLPVEQNAFDITPYKWNSGTKTRKFITNTTPQALIAFYKEQMKGRGWTSTFTNTNSSSWISLGFEWIDPSGLLPYDLRSLVTIQDSRVVDEGNKGPAYVSLSVIPVPKLSRVPLYPDAGQVETRYLEIPTGYEDDHITEKRITYFTSAAVDQVKSYYNEVLPPHGWGESWGEYLDDVTELGIPGSLVFSWRMGGPETGMMAASVGVIVEQEEASTKVVLRIRGETYFGR